MATRTDIFTWRFFDDIAWWAAGVAVLVAVSGGLMTHGWSFPLTCLAVAGVDIAIVHIAAKRGGGAVAAGTFDSGAIALFAGRLVFKVVVLVGALMLSSVVSFWGAVAGALVYDTTLAFGGSVLSASRLVAAGR